MTLAPGQTTIVSGFRFLFSGTENSPLLHRADGSGGAASPGKYHHIHHNSFEHSGTGWSSIDVVGDAMTSCNETTMVHPSVLYASNRLVDTRLAMLGTACSFADGQAQHRLWFQDSRPDAPTGTWPEILFVEDNEFFTINLVNTMDCNYGGRYTFRFNAITGTSGNIGSYLEIHGEQGGNRGCPWKEMYGNVKSGGVDNFFGLAFIRSGSGMVWGNRVPATAQVMRLDDQRSWRTDIDQCDGTSAIDGNTPGTNGYPCRDQIGRIRDASFTGDETAPQTELAPLYFWNNYAGSGTAQYVPALNNTGGFVTTHVVENRDWYTEETTYNGTTGVGIGTLAARPGTCTTGVAYWATDQGTWDSVHSGTDGQLYKCTATDTWTLLYTPVPYPHPLSTSDAVPPVLTRVMR